MNDRIIYSLTVSDIQNVAQQESGKDLSNKELEIIIENINKNINWYETIAAALDELE